MLVHSIAVYFIAVYFVKCAVVDTAKVSAFVKFETFKNKYNLTLC